MLDDIFATDDRVVIRMIIRGTYIGEELPGFPKKGERFAMGGVSIYRFVDGKIVDDWGIQVTCPTDSPWVKAHSPVMRGAACAGCAWSLRESTESTCNHTANWQISARSGRRPWRDARANRKR